MSNENRAPQVSTGLDEDLPADYGEEYLEWKNWNPENFGNLTKHGEANFSALIKKAKTLFPPHSRALEIGFGKGSFLTYGAKRQWEMYGTEASPELVEQAKRKGFHAFHTDNLKTFPDDYFNLVLAFDVLEHIPQERLLDFLREVRRVLKDKGVFMARFPNGDSPFGRCFQHGDATHVTTIGSGKVTYFAGRLRVAIVYLGAEIKPLWSGPIHFAYRVVAIPVKNLLNIFLNLIIFPGELKALCSPNLILIFRAVKSVPPTPPTAAE